MKEQLRELYNDYPNIQKVGKGNDKGDVMVIYAGPKFDNSNYIKSTVRHLEIPEKELFVTPLIKNEDMSNEDLEDIIVSEIATIAPDIVLVVGRVVKEALRISVPFKKGYGLYVPVWAQEQPGILIPTEGMVGSMPKYVKKRYNNRLNEFKEDFKDRSFSQDRLAAGKIMREFEEEFGFTYNKSLSQPKSYWMMFSNEIHDYVIVTNSKASEKTIRDAIDFGVVVTEDDMKQLTKEDGDMLLSVLKDFNGSIEKIIPEG